MTASSLRWRVKHPRGSSSRERMAAWWPATKRPRQSGASTRWLRPLKRPASRSNALRSAPSSCARACGGATPTVGERLATRTSSQKDGGRHPLHPATRGLDDHLHRRTRPVVPRTFPPAPGWSPNGHRIKAEMDYGRGPEKTWVYGALRVRDGKELTRCAASRNSKGYIALLADIEADNPHGDICIISDNLSSHNSLETRTWLEGHPRIHHVFIPTGACWLNLQEGWWRLFRRDALAGQSFANPDEIE